jgi:hypothetical protein
MWQAIGLPGPGVIQAWGYSVVSDGRVAGDQFRFTVDKYSQNRAAEKIEFSGAVMGKSMMLAMIDGWRQETTLHRLESRGHALEGEIHDKQLKLTMRHQMFGDDTGV